LTVKPFTDSYPEVEVVFTVDRDGELDARVGGTLRLFGPFASVPIVQRKATASAAANFICGLSPCYGFLQGPVDDPALNILIDTRVAASTPKDTSVLFEDSTGNEARRRGGCTIDMRTKDCARIAINGQTVCPSCLGEQQKQRKRAREAARYALKKSSSVHVPDGDLPRSELLAALAKWKRKTADLLIRVE